MSPPEAALWNVLRAAPLEVSIPLMRRSLMIVAGTIS